MTAVTSAVRRTEAVLLAGLHGLTPDDAERAVARTAAHDAVRAGLIRQVVGAGSTGGR